MKEFMVEVHRRIVDDDARSGRVSTLDLLEAATVAARRELTVAGEKGELMDLEIAVSVFEAVRGVGVLVSTIPGELSSMVTWLLSVVGETVEG